MFLPGCYLAHLADGQLRLLRAARSIDVVLADPSTEASVRHALERVEPVRAAARAWGLDVDGQYRTYVDWPGDRVVTTVVATRPGEVEPAGFWFPVLGRMPYKGFFDAARAEAEASRLRSDGLDTCVVPVSAYSTLGWFTDPVTTPLLRRGTERFVETLFHELVHATVFFSGDAGLSEGVATFIGQEAAIRFFAEHEGSGAAEAVRARVADERAIARQLGALRGRVVALYGSPPTAEAVDERREALSKATRAALAALPLRVLDPPMVAAAARLNDACLALAATYETDLDAYAQQLAAREDDLAAFVSAVRAAAESDDPRAALGLPPARREPDSTR
jgi:predicted aminopeptidase